MTVDLADQLRELCSAMEEEQGPLSPHDVMNRATPVIPTDSVSTRTMRRRTWHPAAAAAVLTVVVVGGLAWQSRNAAVPPVQEPSTNVTSDTTLPTESTVPTPTTTAVPDLGLLPDTGPRLNFVSAESPSGSILSRGVWFNDALYAVGWSDPDAPLQLYRSVDGLNWELVSGAASIFAGATNALPVLGSDGDRIVSVALGSDCLSRGDFLSVSLSLNGTDWSSSQIEPPIPGASNSAGCYSVEIGDLAVGVHGIVVTATVHSTIDIEGAAERLVGAQADGTFSWWSADGQNWQTIEPSLEDVVATADGFTGRARIGAGLPKVWTSEDGTTWTNTGVMMLHRDLAVFPDGQVVTAGTFGIRAIDDPNTAIIGATGTYGLNVQIGEFGLIGTTTRNSQTKRTVLFSDGTTWSRWVPPAFQSVSEPSELILVGIGDEFVVLRQVGRQVGSQLDLLWVGTLP